jgi:hypothetical protein
VFPVQRDKQTDGFTVRQTVRETNSYRLTEGQTDKQTDGFTVGQTVRETKRVTDKQDIQTNRQTDLLSDRHLERQTE